jgi:hypothetical protein
MAKRTALILVTAAMLAALAAAAGVAGADPVNSKNLQIYELDCGGELVTVSTIFNNNSIVVHEVGTTGNFVATRIAGTFTFTNPETGEIVEEPFEVTTGKGKKKGLGDGLTTCTTTDTFEDPEVGTVNVDLTVTGFFTPRRG